MFHILLPKEGDSVENSKKILRIIMIGMVLIAVVMGLVYYYHETQNEQMAKRGTLISVPGLGWYESWQE